jgi:hypothetical protein
MTGSGLDAASLLKDDRPAALRDGGSIIQPLIGSIVGSV